MLGKTTLHHQETGRPLLTPDEVRRLPEDQALVFPAGHPPIRGVRTPCFRDRELAKRAGTPPPGESDRIGREGEEGEGEEGEEVEAGPRSAELDSILELK